ncbi:MAG TPA: HD domain-containing phosphohydrolase [Planctomycetaceae bacterium]|nr:HD domain-containing phosphohydrolase [Planctomycetaceae bacterium]
MASIDILPQQTEKNEHGLRIAGTAVSCAIPAQARDVRPIAPAVRRNDVLTRDTVAKSARIMIVDDESINIKVVRKYLQGAGYENFVVTTDSLQAMELIARERPDVVLLDIMMPQLSGMDILKIIRADERFEHLPVLILTAACDMQTKLQALDLGATDFLAKPVDFADLLPRVRNALLVKSHQDHLTQYAERLEGEVQLRTAELAASRQEVIKCLARAAEFRDDDTGHHVVRVGRYTGIIAREMGMDDAWCELIEQAAQLHDVGKIGIPDAILLKPGKLDPEEFERMQKHAIFGKRIIQPLPANEYSELQEHAELGAQIMGAGGSPIIEMAARIAMTHHEKWDGSGYPLKLAGEDIPIEGRITAVADVFDALSSKRPYKPAFPLDKCFSILEEGRNKHFDGRVLDAFFARREEIVNVQIAYAELD